MSSAKRLILQGDNLNEAAYSICVVEDSHSWAQADYSVIGASGLSDDDDG